MSTAFFHDALSHALADAGAEAPPGAVATVARQLADHYADPVRAYHSSAHIRTLLTDARTIADLLQSTAAVKLAILFHDIIYDPQRHDNEESSAACAAAALPMLGVSPSMIARVSDLVLATKHGATQPDPADIDCALLLDLDLTVLGGKPEAYRAYAHAIRQEYNHVPEAVYRSARARILEQFLATPSIYRTDRFRLRLEDLARANLTDEIASLRKL